MAWTTPATITTGTLVTASLWNTQIVGNLYFLKTNVSANLFLAASSGRPDIVSPCATANATTHPTNDIDLVTLDFDPTTQERAQWSGYAMPPDYDGGTIGLQFVWSHGAGGTAWGVSWYLNALALTDGDPIDSAWGAAAIVDDTGASGGSILYFADIDNATPGGTPEGGCFMCFRATRYVSRAGDTMNLDAKLAGVKLSYNRFS